jgi:hypothetical protein
VATNGSWVTMIKKINPGSSGARRTHFSRRSRAAFGVRFPIARGPRRVRVAPVSAVVAVIALVSPSLPTGHFW